MRTSRVSREAAGLAEALAVSRRQTRNSSTALRHTIKSEDAVKTEDVKEDAIKREDHAIKRENVIKKENPIKREDIKQEGTTIEREDTTLREDIKREVGKKQDAVIKREDRAKREVKRESVKEEVKREEGHSSGLSSANTTDIEDLLSANPKKRKRESKSPTPTIKKSTRSPRRVVKAEQEHDEKKVIGRRLPARNTTSPNGEVVIAPPSNWEAIYDTVKSMRERDPTAPVDTMGCAELYWRSSSPRDRRFQTLIALMLSSQTKDTVTAVAMQRLHTQLSDETHDAAVAEVWDHDHQTTPSTLTLEHVLDVSSTRLNELIRTVGFHNNKTKYIKATAVILRDEFNSDIPSTIQGLTRLPGVGPKMAYLCMSSAWNRHEGIGVDVHVHRITNMWGWHKTKTPEATRAALESWLPRDKWHEINKLLVGLGQTVCLPIGKRCGECDLAGTGLCKAEVKGKGAGSLKRQKDSKKEEEEEEKDEKEEELGDSIGFPVVKGESKIGIKVES
ncbi:alpha,alpha-trehalase nth1 [Arthroderma sp. PD_2]|nr:alpha,alpha-trehalase nth1 [Arthroderma sp. PD_2]